MAEDLETLKKEIDNLKKQKIIMQAKLKQKEDKITDLTKRVRELQIESKESGQSKDLETRLKDLEEELDRSKKINQSLRSETNRLESELDEAKKALTSAPKAIESPKIQPVSSMTQQSESGPTPEEVQYLQQQLIRKDEIIARLNDQLEMVNPQELSQASGSYMKIRQLNSKIRELKSQVDLAKKSETAMKERLLEFQRKQAVKDDDFNW